MKTSTAPPTRAKAKGLMNKHIVFLFADCLPNRPRTRPAQTFESQGPNEQANHTPPSGQPHPTGSTHGPAPHKPTKAKGLMNKHITPLPPDSPTKRSPPTVPPRPPAQPPHRPPAGRHAGHKAGRPAGPPARPHGRRAAGTRVRRGKAAVPQGRQPSPPATSHARTHTCTHARTI